MRRSIIFAGLVLFFFLTVLAQEPPAQVPKLTNDAGPEEVTNRLVTLNECVQLSLKHNYVIKIQEYAPQLVGYDLKGAYGAYDPAFRAIAQHRHSTSEGSLDELGRVIPNSVQDRESIETGFSGLLPTGLKYDLSGDLSHTDGSRGVLGGSLPIDNYQGSVGAFTLSQPFLRDSWIDNTRFGIQVLKKDLQISELQFRFTVMDIVTQVEIAYHEYMFTLTNIVVAEDALKLAERSVYEVKKKVEVGQLAELEQKSADAEVERARADLITARFNAQVQENVLKGLITDNFAELHKVRLVPAERLKAEPRFINLGDTWLEALAKRPDFKQQLLALDKANLQIKYSRNQLFPWLNAFGSYGRTGFSDMGNEREVFRDFSRNETPQHSYGLEFRVPLTMRTERNAFKSAKVIREQEEIRLKQLQQGILIEIDNAVNRIKAAFEAIAATRQARIFAEAALDAEQKKFENGKSTTFNVLQFQRDLTGARRDEIRSLVTYNQALADLEFKKGSTLEKRGIAITVD